MGYHLVVLFSGFSGLASNACVAIVGDSNPTGQCAARPRVLRKKSPGLARVATNYCCFRNPQEDRNMKLNPTKAVTLITFLLFGEC